MTMNRRNLIKNLSTSALGLGAIGILAPRALANVFEGVGDDTVRTPFVLIGHKNSPELKSLLQSMQAFMKSEKIDLSSQMTLLDLERDAVAIQNFMEIHGPHTDAINEPILIRIPEIADDENSVETWTHQWFSHRYQSLIAGACYPVSGGWWSVDGDFNPTIKKVRDHLDLSRNHVSGKFETDYLLALEFNELQSLHSDHHREMTRRGKVQWKFVNRECPTV